MAAAVVTRRCGRAAATGGTAAVGFIARRTGGFAALSSDSGSDVTKTILGEGWPRGADGLPEAPPEMPFAAEALASFRAGNIPSTEEYLEKAKAAAEARFSDISTSQKSEELGVSAADFKVPHLRDIFSKVLPLYELDVEKLLDRRIQQIESQDWKNLRKEMADVPSECIDALEHGTEAEEDELQKLVEVQQEAKAMCADFEEKFDSYMEDMKKTMFEFEKDMTELNTMRKRLEAEDPDVTVEEFLHMYPRLREEIEQELSEGDWTFEPKLA